MEDDREVRAREEEVSENGTPVEETESWKSRFRRFSAIRPRVMSGRMRIALLLLVGFAIGAAVKTEAAGRLTIGFQDYTVPVDGARYDLNDMERQVAEKQATQGDSAQAAGLPGGAACGQ